MRLTRQLIIVIIVLLSCISCIGDGILWIKGNIVDINDNAVNNCVLKLCLAEDGRTLRNISVDSKFDIDLTVNPRTEEYFIIIQCDKDFYSYKSEVYEISGTKNKPLNIGKIVLKRKTN